jgi:hypothetical protein
LVRKSIVKVDVFFDLHRLQSYIEHRLQQLESDGKIGDGLEVGRVERDAILELVKARHEVSDLRRSTYLA